MVEHVEGGTIDWEWDGSSKGQKLFRCTCDQCGNLAYRTKGSIKLSLKGMGRLGCVSCSKRLDGNQAAINRAWERHNLNTRTRNMFQGLTKEQWYELSTSDCYYCGSEPATVTKSRHTEFVRNGIDRVHNEVGYTPDNCVPCCFKCNSAKSVSTQKEFIEMCNRVARLHPERD